MEILDIFFIVFVSVRAVSRSHQSTVASSGTDTAQCGFWLQAGCYLLLLYIIQMA